MGLLSIGDLSPGIWHDASEAGSVTLSGSLVTQWNDLSGNGRHSANTTGANRPTYVNAQINGLNALQFVDGQQNFLSLSDATFSQNVSQMSVFAIISRTGGNASRGGIVGWNTGVGNARAYIFAEGSLARAGGRRLDADVFQEVTASWTAAQVNLVGGLFDYSTANVYVDVNGVLTQRSGGWQTAGSTPSTGGIGRIGTGNNASENLTGYYCEIAAFRSVPNVATRQKIEGILLWKWGAQARLPSDHPYKNAAPRKSAGGAAVHFFFGGF